jgi:DNA-binding MarR family transcriptional regulator
MAKKQIKQYERLADAELDIMRVLWQTREAMRAAQIVKQLSETRSWKTQTAHVLLGRLEEKGFVERKTDPENKRKTLVFPTEKLLGTIPSVRKITADWNRLVAEGISEEEFAVFQSVLFRMEKNAREIIENEEAKPEK